MNIKSLLFGSAAALVAVSGARAADAVVVAEPEPAEYVRICDVYGAGYFYIPGTETCLRVGGYVRMDVNIGDGVMRGRTTFDHRDGSLNDTYKIVSRFALKTWTGQETELGTLSTFTETRFDYVDGLGTSTNLAQAWIQLGGLRMGRTDSLYNAWGGAGNVDYDSIVPYGLESQTNLISYTFDAGNGFSAAISLEQGIASSFGHNYVIDSYVPHVVGGVKYTAGWGGISGVVGYDSVHSAWAGKVRLDVQATEQLSLFVMGGYGSNKLHNEYGVRAPVPPATVGTFGLRGAERHSLYKPWGGNWAVWGGGTYQINEKTQASLALSYDDDKTFGAAVAASYDIVPGFTVTGEIDYMKWDAAARVKDDAIGGLIRFQRSF